MLACLASGASMPGTLWDQTRGRCDPRPRGDHYSEVSLRCRIPRRDILGTVGRCLRPSRLLPRQKGHFTLDENLHGYRAALPWSRIINAVVTKQQVTPKVQDTDLFLARKRRQRRLTPFWQKGTDRICLTCQKGARRRCRPVPACFTCYNRNVHRRMER